MDALLLILSGVLIAQGGALVCLRQSPKAIRSLCYWGLALADSREKLQNARRKISRERDQMFEALDQGGNGEPVELLTVRFDSRREVEGRDATRIRS